VTYVNPWVTDVLQVVGQEWSTAHDIDYILTAGSTPPKHRGALLPLASDVEVFSLFNRAKPHGAAAFGKEFSLVPDIIPASLYIVQSKTMK